MRRIFPLLLLCALPALADTPAGLQPLPEPPAPPAGYEPDAALEPQVTIKKRDADTVEEFRVQGKLYMIKVTPPHGTPYFLIDNQGDGNFSRMETMDSRTRVPQWVIGTF